MMNNNDYTLLIVDDNPTNLKVLFDFLKDYGFRVLVAKDGQAALDRLKMVTPDLILLDVMMPIMDGFETCKNIKENPVNQDLPIIFMTALADTENKVKGLSLGAVDYITKPFQQEEVLARINLQLKLCSLTKELAVKNQQLTELNANLETKVQERTTELQKTQSQLILGEKMSSLGELMSGIAHEINNPLSFLGGNIHHLQEYTQDIVKLIKLYQKYYPNPTTEIAETIEDIELDYLTEDLTEITKTMGDAIKRITDLIASMKIFSHSDVNKKAKFNIETAMESSLTLLKHRLKANAKRPGIEIIRNYEKLPDIECYPGQINQIVMNLLSNAIDALEEGNEGRSFKEIELNPNQIYLTTKLKQDQGQVMLQIRDNGIGMSAEIQHKIFDNLFTTKPVGKGTGLGLSIVRQIVEKHGGEITVVSAPKAGTSFNINLPLKSNLI